MQKVAKSDYSARDRDELDLWSPNCARLATAVAIIQAHLRVLTEPRTPNWGL